MAPRSKIQDPEVRTADFAVIRFCGFSDAACSRKCVTLLAALPLKSPDRLLRSVTQATYFVNLRREALLGFHCGKIHLLSQPVGALRSNKISSADNSIAVSNRAIC